MEEVERLIGNATDAARDAVRRVRELPAGMNKADYAMRLNRELRSVADEAAALHQAQILYAYDTEDTTLGKLASRFGVSKTRVVQIIRARDELAGRADDPPERTAQPSDAPEPPPVAAAIITSARGVLIARRQDGDPPWTFPAGKIEPGESASVAAVRETEEETGLVIRTGGVIGRRVHPTTGAVMVYVAARPVADTDVRVADERELAEVRWATLPEVEKLMGPTLYGAVRAHLARRLGKRPAADE
jgi:8-oxo-dGTP pyrophosphatase MutT (NUDIX family)